MSASGSPQTPDASADWDVGYPVDLGAVLGPFVRGRRDPAVHVDRQGAHWRTLRTPEGPATLRLTPPVGEGTVVGASAWGPGGRWAVDSVPSLLGSGDDPSGFPHERLPSILDAVWRRYGPRWRTPRSGRVVEAAVAAVLEQKVTGVESRRSWAALLTRVGEPAPGPTPRPMHVFPDPAAIRRVPSWQWHRWGVQPQQSATVLRVAQAAGRLEECLDLTIAEARRRLSSLAGIGPWTVAEVGSRALGDADAVSVADFHLAGQVVYAFTGRIDGDDEQMLDLLAPFAGHRYRVQRLVEMSGVTRPARGPRATINDHRSR